ncbi:MAG: Arc family DNA binding domain-containing protein [Planctomycetaceae bacterium]
MERIVLARESFLLRTDPKIVEALRRWAEDELRSANGQLDFILRRALKDAGRLPSNKKPNSDPNNSPEDSE